MIVLDGKVVANELKAKLKTEAEKFFDKNGRKPGLGVIIIGDDPASHVYVKNKERACESVHFISKKIALSSSANQSEVINAIKVMNADSQIDAYLIQMPLPSHLNSELLLDMIDPLKDADGLHPVNMGYLWVGRKRVTPCTPWGVVKILNHYNIPVKGKSVVVVGRSQIVGKPMAHLLTSLDATVTVCHRYTVDLHEITTRADIVVVAAGQRQMFGRKDFKKCAIIIDVGIHGSGQGHGVVGDVRYSELEDWATGATPVPGGVGPMTIACLLENTLILAKMRANEIESIK